jgi:hypothetical protein
MSLREAADRVRALLFRHNPFYLLSALSMLVGCYTLSNALRLEAGQSWKLLVLLGTLHLYEFLLIGLALFLVVRRSLPRDGSILLRLEVLFLLDATLLNAEAFTADPATGALANGACLALAALKLSMILKALDVRLGRLGSAAYGHGLALVAAMPGVFALLAQARILSAATVHAAWWPLGLLIVMMAGVAGRATAHDATHSVARSFLTALGIGLPISLGVHLVASGWVHQVAFHLSYLGPVLIGLGVARMLVEVRWVAPEWSLWLPAAGVLLSLGSPAEMTMPGPLGIGVSPFREALFFAGLGYLAGWRLLGESVFGWAAATTLVLGAAGHSPAAIAATLGSMWRGLRGGGGKLFPTTAAGWGVLSVVSAFVLLAAGAWVSLFRNPAAPPSPDRN